MSIATEISRLQTAKSNIKTAIEAAGVTVPAATTLDGYSAKVAEIPEAIYDDLSEEQWGATSGYGGLIVSRLVVSPEEVFQTYIKFEMAPSDANDYDACVSTSGEVSGLPAYSGKTKVYIWSGDVASLSSVVINDVAYAGGTTYDTATNVTLSGCYEIDICYRPVTSTSGGSND